MFVRNVLFGNLLNGLLRMLLGGIINDDVNSPELIESFFHRLLTKFLLADISID